MVTTKTTSPTKRTKAKSEILLIRCIINVETHLLVMVRFKTLHAAEKLGDSPFSWFSDSRTPRLPCRYTRISDRSGHNTNNYDSVNAPTKKNTALCISYSQQPLSLLSAAIFYHTRYIITRLAPVVLMSSVFHCSCPSNNQAKMKQWTSCCDIGLQFHRCRIIRLTSRHSCFVGLF